MTVGRKLAVLVAVGLVCPFVGTSASTAELPVTVPATTTAETGAAALAGVSVRDIGTADEVVFTFVGDALPMVEATVGVPPFRNIAGEEVAVAGTSFARVRMFPARVASFGDSCLSGLPAPPSPGAGEALVDVFASCRDGLNGPAPVVASPRLVATGTDSALLQSAMGALLAGPSAADIDAGLSSAFSSATSAMVQSASIAPDGSATVDFDPALAATIPNASTSAGSDELLRQLDATTFQFSAATSVTYTLGGSCDAFFGWLQLACAPRTPLDGSAAHYAVTYPGPDRVTGPSTNVTEAVQVTDFEAQMTWVIGMQTLADVTVTTATSPARLIVRVAHPAPAPAPVTVVVATPAFTG